MKRRLVPAVISLAFVLVTMGQVSAVLAQCGVSCAVICGNRCQYQCFDCNLNACIINASICCQQAYERAGDTAPCD
jgi:hypothetical protein